MIDCIKIHSLPVPPQLLLNNGLLTFTLSNIAITGEILDKPQIAYCQSMQFKIRGNYSGLKGSLHK